MDIGMHLSLMEVYPTTLAIRILATKHLLLMDAFLALLSIPQIAMKLNDSSVRHKFSCQFAPIYLRHIFINQTWISVAEEIPSSHAVLENIHKD